MSGVCVIGCDCCECCDCELLLLLLSTGANIGMFSVFAELQFDSPNALCIIAVEPVSHNCVLLRRNLDLYAPTAEVLQLAVGEEVL